MYVKQINVMSKEYIICTIRLHTFAPLLIIITGFLMEH